MNEIRVRVTRQDIERAYEFEAMRWLETERVCAVAQALMRLGLIGVEVHEDGRVDIGMDRYEVIDESPSGERLSRFIRDFDESVCIEEAPEPDEFVLRQVVRTA